MRYPSEALLCMGFYFFASPQDAPLLHGDIARDLHHPGLIGMRRHPRNMDLPAAQMDKKEHVVRHQAGRRPDLGGEEVRSDEDLHMRVDKFFPGGGLLPLWSRRETVALQDVSHGLVAESVPEIGQGAHNAIIAPGAILARHAHHQGLQLRSEEHTSE